MSTKEMTWNAIKAIDGGGNDGVPGFPWFWIAVAAGVAIVVSVAVKVGRKGKPKKKK